MATYIYKSDDFSPSEICEMLADHYNLLHVEFADQVYRSNDSDGETGWQTITPEAIIEMLAELANLCKLLGTG